MVIIIFVTFLSVFLSENTSGHELFLLFYTSRMKKIEFFLSLCSFQRIFLVVRVKGFIFFHKIYTNLYINALLLHKNFMNIKQCKFTFSIEYSLKRIV